MQDGCKRIGTVRSGDNGWRACGDIPEHGPMLYFVRRATWSQPFGVLRMKPTRDRQGTECRTRATWSVQRLTVFEADRRTSLGVIGDMPGAADDSDCHPGRLSSRRAKGA